MSDRQHEGTARALIYNDSIKVSSIIWRQSKVYTVRRSGLNKMMRQERTALFGPKRDRV